jgi:thioredoxin-related protein
MQDTLSLIVHALLWLLVFILYVAVFFLYRHLGRKLRRPEQGPRTDSPINIALTTLRGDPYTLGASKPHVVLFSQVGCNFCERIRPLVGRLAGTHINRIGIVVVHGGDEEGTRKYVREMPPGVIAVSDQDGELRQHWKVTTAPFMVVMDFDGMVIKKGTAGTEDLVNSFFQDASKLQPKTEGADVKGRTAPGK